MITLSALQRLLHTKSTNNDVPRPAQPVVSIESKFQAKKSKIYKLIANDMGSYWREFGRELNIPESVLDNLEFDRRSDIPTMTRRILELTEQRHTNNMVEQLFEALAEIGRNDLVKQIKIILNQ